MISMLASGSGELSGTSMAPKPASTMTAAIESASSGVTPRRMATSGVGASVKRHSSPPSRAMRKSPRAAARGGAARAETPSACERGKIALDQRLCARDMRLLARKEPPRLADFRADQEAGEIFAASSSGEAAHKRQRSRAKQEAEQAGLSFAARRRSAAANAERERLSRALGGRGPGEGAGDRMVPQRREQFAGDEGLERDDAIALDPRPFRMRAGQHDQAGAGIGDAEDFRFLAPHHIRLCGFIDIGQARPPDERAGRRPRPA